MGRKLKARKNKRYTIMIMPHRRGRVFEMSISTLALILGITLTLGFIVYGVLATYINYSEKQRNISYKKELSKEIEKYRDLDAQLYALEELNQSLLVKNKEYLSGNRAMSEKIQEMTEMEIALAEALEDVGLNKKLKTVGVSSFSNYKEDFNAKIDATIELVEKVKIQSAMLKRIPSRLPAQGSVTSLFGRRVHPVSGAVSKQHNGVDIGNDTGTPIYATADGNVKFSGWKSGFGYLVIIDHQNGYESYYAHNSRLLAKEGKFVERGDRIALMGSTGVSTGPHSHFEVRYFGVPMDPMKLIN